MTEARAVALALCAATLLLQRLHELRKRLPLLTVETQVALADSQADLALIGRMSGKAGAAMLVELGVEMDL